MMHYVLQSAVNSKVPEKDRNPESDFYVYTLYGTSQCIMLLIPVVTFLTSYDNYYGHQ